MLQNLRSKSMKVVLASASPRRRALLAQVGIEAVVHPAAFAEVGGMGTSAKEVAEKNAIGKCREVLAVTGDGLPLIAADTIVVIDNMVLGKPADAAAAAEMLKRLSGRTHKVMTAVAVAYKGRQLVDVCVTEVTFRSLSNAEINAYVATGEPLDKAGAYGIQGRGAILVERINGCYNNVVGLPLAMLYSMLKKIGAISENFA